MGIREIQSDMDWIYLTQDKDQRRVLKLRVP
jgi:hypothetical protein